jgi:hypothetical protein
MIRLSLEAIVVTDSKLFRPSGTIGRWAASVERQYTLQAIKKAPSSLESGRPHKTKRNSAYPSGSMRRNIEGRVVMVGPRHYQTTISVNVPYALMVIRGTRTPIIATSARQPAGSPGGIGGQFKSGKMYLPGQPSWGRRWKQQVSGQTANNFLGEAFDATARRHSSLRGYQMVG